MTAVAEPAIVRQRLDVVEGRPQPLLGVDQPEFAHAGRVEDQRAAGQPHQFAVGGGVAPACVVLADSARGHPLGPGKRIDQRGFAGAGGADQHAGFAGPEMRSQFGHAVAGHGRDREHGGAERHGLCRRDHAVQFIAEVCLGQHDHRPRPALPGGGQITFEPPEIEVSVHRGDEKGHVDIRRHHLHGLHRVGRLAEERGPARQDGVDGGRAFNRARRNGDPVADDRMAAFLGFVDKTSRELRTQFAVVGHEGIEAALLDDDASRHVALRRIGRECLTVAVRPAIKADQGSWIDQGSDPSYRNGRVPPPT